MIPLRTGVLCTPPLVVCACPAAGAEVATEEPVLDIFDRAVTDLEAGGFPDLFPDWPSAVSSLILHVAQYPWANDDERTRAKALVARLHALRQAGHPVPAA